MSTGVGGKIFEQKVVVDGMGEGGGGRGGGGLVKKTRLGWGVCGGGEKSVRCWKPRHTDGRTGRQRTQNPKHCFTTD